MSRLLFSLDNLNGLFTSLTLTIHLALLFLWGLDVLNMTLLFFTGQIGR